LAEHGAGYKQVRDGDGDDALLCAPIRGQAETVRWLTENGADVNTENKEGYTPLEGARNKLANLEIGDNNCSEDEGIQAVLDGYRQIIKFLTNLEIKKNKQDTEGTWSQI